MPYVSTHIQGPDTPYQQFGLLTMPGVLHATQCDATALGAIRAMAVPRGSAAAITPNRMSSAREQTSLGHSDRIELFLRRGDHTLSWAIQVMVVLPSDAHRRFLASAGTWAPPRRRLSLRAISLLRDNDRSTNYVHHLTDNRSTGAQPGAGEGLLLLPPGSTLLLFLRNGSAPRKQATSMITSRRPSCELHRKGCVRTKNPPSPVSSAALWRRRSVREDADPARCPKLCPRRR